MQSKISLLQVTPSVHICLLLLDFSLEQLKKSDKFLTHFS